MVLLNSVGCSGKYVVLISQWKIWQNSFGLFAIECTLHWSVGGILAFVYLYVSGK